MLSPSELKFSNSWEDACLLFGGFLQEVDNGVENFSFSHALTPSLSP